MNIENKPMWNGRDQDLYLDLDLIFLLFLFSLLIRFFLHLALMVKLALLYSVMFRHFISTFTPGLLNQ